MSTTIGKKIADLRRERGFTQEELAERLSVSPQAVSKWENDLSCPDIMLLPALGDLFGVSVDTLLSRERAPDVQLLPADRKRSFDTLVLRICINSAEGDKVRVNLPMPLIKVGIEMGLSLSQVSGSDKLRDINLAQVLALVERGLIGKLVEIESSDGDTVEIVVD